MTCRIIIRQCNAHLLSFTHRTNSVILPSANNVFRRDWGTLSPGRVTPRLGDRRDRPRGGGACLRGSVLRLRNERDAIGQTLYSQPYARIPTVFFFYHRDDVVHEGSNRNEYLTEVWKTFDDVYSLEDCLGTAAQIAGLDAEKAKNIS